MSYTLIISLILVGFLLLALEILVLPGTTVAGILGVGGIVFAIYSAFSHFGQTAGWIVLASTIAAAIVFLVVILRSKTWKKLQLDTSLESKVNTQASQVREGDCGVSISRLAPMGTAEIDGDYYEVQSLLSFVDAQKKVKVVKVEGSKIWVKEEKTDEQAADGVDTANAAGTSPAHVAPPESSAGKDSEERNA